MTENVGRTTSFKDSIKGKQCFEVFCFILPAVIIVIVTVCLLVLKRIADPLCTMNSTQYMENITGNLLMDKPFANGSLVTVDGMTYPRGYHWSSDGTIWGCPCLLKPCIYKCCDKHESHVYEEYEYYGETVKTTNCENDHVPFSPKKSEIYSVKDVLKQRKVNVDDDHFFVINGDGQCRGRGLFALSDTEKKETYLLEDGRLYSSALHKPYWNYTEFCVESLNDRVTNHFMICFEEESFDFKHEEGLDWHFVFRVVGMVVSLPCLIITLVVYAMLPLLNNLHGKSLKYYVFCLTVAYCCLGFLQIFVINMPKSLCSALGFVIQFTVLTSFFWLNVMCFDIWWVFSGLMPLRGSQQATEQFKFRMYSLYAWGCPSVILIISLIMEYAPGIPHNAIKPEMGITKCFFKGNDAKLLYFYLPIGVLVYLNVVMFVTTALRFKSHSKSVKKLQRGDSRRHCQAGDSTTDMQRFSLYLKLFVVMGISWVLELITYFVQSDSIFFLLMDLSNGLQGVFILYIFVWKRPILTQLKERLNSRSFFSTYSSDKTVNCSGTDSTGSAMIPSVHRKISEQSTTSSCDTSV